MWEQVGEAPQAPTELSLASVSQLPRDTGGWEDSELSSAHLQEKSLSGLCGHGKGQEGDRASAWSLWPSLGSGRINSTP